MRKPRYAGAAISKRYDDGCQRHGIEYPRRRQLRLSRPSRIRSAAEAAEQIQAYMARRYWWVKGPPGFPMPRPSDYGLALAAPSSDEVAHLVGGGP
jgi:hypothetical protein